VIGGRHPDSQDTLTRKVETTKTIVDISSLPRKSTEALSGSKTSVNGVKEPPAPRGGVDELDSLIAAMRESAERDDDIEVSVTRAPQEPSVHVRQQTTARRAEYSSFTDSSVGLVKDPATGQHRTLQDDVTAEIVDGKTSSGTSGKLADTTTRRRVDIDIDIGVIVPEKRGPRTLDKALSSGLIDTKTGMVTDSSTGRKITIAEAVAKRIIDGKTSSVVDPSTGRSVSLDEALKLGIVDGETGKVVDRTTGRNLDINDAVRPGVADARKQERLSLDEALSSGVMDTQTGLVTDPSSGRKVTVSEAVAMGIIDGRTSSVTDPSTGRSVSLDEALRLGIVDGRSGRIVNLDSGESIGMSEAAQSGLIVPQSRRITAEVAGRSDVSSGSVSESFARRQVTLQQQAVVDTAGARPTEGVATGAVNGTTSSTGPTSSRPATSPQSSAVVDVAKVSLDSASSLR